MKINEFGLILCEGCGGIMDEENTESYKEVHGPGHLETLSRTTCCRSGYTDVDGQTIVDFLGEVREAMAPPWKVRQLDGELSMVPKALSQIQRDNLDAIIPILETVWEL